LDLKLPNEDGLTLARWLHDNSQVGIIMLTGRGHPIDHILGLEMGTAAQKFAHIQSRISKSCEGVHRFGRIFVLSTLFRQVREVDKEEGAMETWATFSIIDHRQPIYRQALAIFDKIVVPIPKEPIGNQTVDELERLTAEVQYLEEEGAAVSQKWDSELFQEWRRPFLAEALSANLNRDVFSDTRLMLAEQLESEEVETVPVYGDMAEYARSKTELMHIEEALTVQITQRLPVPEHDTPFAELIKLRRENDAFRTALTEMLEWKRHRAREILGERHRAPEIAAALRDFDTYTKKYADAMRAAGHQKMVVVGSILISAAMLDVRGVIKEGLVSFRELREPSWKKVSEMKCAPGGVVYHFQEAMK
jgi:hypothetical protein